MKHLPTPIRCRATRRAASRAPPPSTASCVRGRWAHPSARRAGHVEQAARCRQQARQRAGAAWEAFGQADRW